MTHIAAKTVPLRAPGSFKEGTLVLAGFFGRGNAGDEAMLQVVYEAFSPRFDIVISLDEVGAFPGFTEWYPYRDARTAHQNHCDLIQRIDDPVGMLVGGGSLSVGFAAGQVFVAKAFGLPVALAGVDLWAPGDDDSPLNRTMRAWLGMFDETIVRTTRSASALRALGMSGFHGGDWALCLRSDDDRSVVHDDRRAVVILREDAPEVIGNDYVSWVENLMRELECNGYRPVFLPFSSQDMAFLESLGLSQRYSVENVWWNAGRLKQIIASSGLTVTAGRLHPMIFAAPTGSRVAMLKPPHWSDPASGEKLTDMADELGIGIHTSIEMLSARLAAGYVGPADPVRVRAATERAGEALKRLHALFPPFATRAA